jgi:S-methylmethionine-dependent homocysteine/selenocysteine methylase
MGYRDALPQLDGNVLLTDGGTETVLIFHEGIDLPCFAIFPLLEQDEGREAMLRYFAPYFDIARHHGVGFVLEANTWRANPAWGAELGYSLDDLAEANRRCIAFAEEIRAREQEPERPVVVSALFGPEGDAYSPTDHLSVEQAQEFHAWQAGIIADTTADLITGLTITYVEEAIGIVRAATAVGMPVVIAFTVETDGRLPSGQALADAIEEVDRETDGVAAYFMINCAHPTHFLSVLDGPGPWHRIRGIRANASTMSHAELDNAQELDDGDPADLARGYLAIGERLPDLVVLGGCCGTDHRHVGSIAEAWFGAPPAAA